MKPIAIQLYTLREQAEKDFPGVLRRVADIGYKGVEPAGLYGYDAKEIGKLIADLGMQVCSSHFGVPAPDWNMDIVVKTAEALGNTRIIGGFGDDFKTIDECKQAAAKFDQATKLLEPYGMSFAFHNHWFEFTKVDGRYAYDILLEEAPNICSELDVYWAAFAEADPVKIISEHKSRIPILHIKDGDLKEPREVMTAVGSGVLPILRIIDAADSDVLEWLVVEMDDCASNMFEAVEESYKYLTSHGLAEGNK